MERILDWLFGPVVNMLKRRKPTPYLPPLSPPLYPSNALFPSDTLVPSSAGA